VVPSLVADIRSEEQGLAPPTPEEETVLVTAAETVEAVEAMEKQKAITCPECGEPVPVAEVANHPHFEVVEA
jgi:hypothetical protein